MQNSFARAVFSALLLVLAKGFRELVSQKPKTLSDQGVRSETTRIRSSAELVSVSDLQDSVEKTSRIRFVAERRLHYHHRLSTWSVALASLALLLLPLCEAFGIAMNLTAGQLAVLQVVLAAFVLIYSLLISLENFPLQAEKMKECGTELNMLARVLKGYGDFRIPIYEYQEFVARYGEILRRYGNHTYADYLVSKLENLRKYSGHEGRWSTVTTFLGASVRTAFAFVHYIVFLFLLGTAILVNFW